MVMSDKGVRDATLLKLTAKLLKRSNLPKGFKLKGIRGACTITSKELIEFVEALAEEFDNGGYGIIRKCETCGNYGHPGRKNKRGWCPSHSGSYLKYPHDFCSYWKPMTPEQKKVKERIDEVFKL